MFKTVARHGWGPGSVSPPGFGSQDQSGSRDVAGDVTVLAVHSGDDGVGCTGDGRTDQGGKPEEPKLGRGAVSVEERHTSGAEPG